MQICCSNLPFPILRFECDSNIHIYSKQNIEINKLANAYNFFANFTLCSSQSLPTNFRCLSLPQINPPLFILSYFCSGTITAFTSADCILIICTADPFKSSNEVNRFSAEIRGTCAGDRCTDFRILHSDNRGRR